MGTSMRFVIAAIKPHKLDDVQESPTTFGRSHILATSGVAAGISTIRSTSVARGGGIALPNFMSKRSFSTSGTKRVAHESDSNAGRANTWHYLFFSG